MGDDRSVVGQLRELRGVRWDWKPGNPLGLEGSDVGVVAQEVEAVFPELVVTGSDGVKRVRYQGLIAPLIEAVKELDARLRAAEATIVELTGESPHQP